MKPYYATGSGPAPTYLASINRGPGGSGHFVFVGKNERQWRIPFGSRASFQTALQELMAEKVPIAIGGHVPGPADEVLILIGSGELSGSFVQICWMRPGQWEVRSIVGGAIEWEQASDAGKVANMKFNPDAFRAC